MALSRTNRGTVQNTYGINANPAVTSASFSPAAGSMLVALVFEITTDATAAITMSTSLTGHGAWTRYGIASTPDTFGNFYQCSLFTSTSGSAPGTGTITATSRPATPTQGTFMETIEVSGQGVVVQSATNTGAGSTITVTFATAPAASSYVFGNCINGAGGAAVPTVPTGWTALGNSGALNTSWVCGDSEKLGSSATAPQWTGLGSFKSGAAAIEISAASGPFLAPRISQAVRRAGFY